MCYEEKKRREHDREWYGWHNIKLGGKGEHMLS